MGYKNSNSLNKYIEPEIITLEEARKVVASLRARIRNQALQMITWRRALQLQEEKMTQMAREKGEELNSLTRQLMLFESRLCKKQNEINMSIKERDVIINRQRRVIRRLQERLAEKKQVSQFSPSSGDVVIVNNNSNNDNDSAVVMNDNEEEDDDDEDNEEEEDSGKNDEEELTPSRFRSRICDVTLMRSISDAAQQPSSYKGRKFNGIITNKVGVLETVYSMEEDEDQAAEPGATNEPSLPETLIHKEQEEEEKEEEEKCKSSFESTAPELEMMLLEAQSDVEGRTMVAVNFDSSPLLEINTSNDERNKNHQDQLIQDETSLNLANEPINEENIITLENNKSSNTAKGEGEEIKLQRKRRNGICNLFDPDNGDDDNYDDDDDIDKEKEDEGKEEKKKKTMVRDDGQQAQVTYNRVMSNHRSVTKPKDVKYKRINKAKSKSLEELRGRLRTWVDKGANITSAVVVVDQSSYA